MRGVDGEDVGFGLGHFHGALQKIARGADCGADTQTALIVFRGARIFEFLLNIFYGDQAFEVEILIDDEKFFDAMFLQNALGFFEGGADGNGDEIVFGHDGTDQLSVIFLKAKIAIGENAGKTRAAVTGRPEMRYLS